MDIEKQMDEAFYFIVIVSNGIFSLIFIGFLKNTITRFNFIISLNVLLFLLGLIFFIFLSVMTWYGFEIYKKRKGDKNE